MSPFEKCVDRLTLKVKELDVDRQIRLFLAAAVALFPSWKTWSQSSTGVASSSLFERSRQDVETHLHKGGESSEVLGTRLLAQIESATPSEPTDTPGFTSAQACWICLDTTVRTVVEQFDPADSTWYLMEPTFQAVSERLFGVSDVGSEQEEAGEARAMNDPQLAGAEQAVEEAIAALRLGNPSTADLASQLAPINPSTGV